ncbi:hypothetical protein HMPREF9623_00201 [Stomatobaculum longum]|uniref:Catalase n=1 Tax=Stomatobaculum longum TaxID=796942 RepID=A0AA37DH18_9FIRM|nr:DUF5662 family protein [Stomatobaculum longum]EHO18017.1 hypothetical protein HMPREF9623_00201 [Stomatobaculum longum]
MRPLFYAKNAIQHFCTITKHKLTVMDLCFKVGLIRQGLAHDLSKYSPTEFMTGVRYFQGVRSPNAAERQELGYSRSWLHHKGRNRHHYEYWVDVDKKRGWVSLKMPLRFVLEMVCDRIAASKVYSGQDYTDAVPLGYYLSKQEGRLLHPETRALLKKLLYMLRDKGEHYTLGYMRWLRRHPALYERREQPVCQ